MLNDMKVGTRLTAGFVAVSMICLVVGLVGYSGLKETGSDVHEIGDVHLKATDALWVIKEAQTETDSAENALLSSKLDAKGRAEQYARFDAAKKQADEHMRIVQSLANSTEISQGWNSFLPAWEAWWKDHEQYAQIAKAYEAAPTDENYKRMSDFALVTIALTFGKAEEALHSLIDLNEKESEAAVTHADAASKRATIILFTAVALSIALAIGLGVVMTRSVVRPLGGEPAEIAGIAEKIARGELGIAFDAKRAERGVYGSMKKMTEKIAEVVGSVQNASGNVAGGAQELSSSAEEMSQGSSEQAGSVEEVSASMEQMVSNIQQNEGAAQVNKAIQQLDQVVQQNASAAEEMASTSEELSSQAEHLQQIMEFFTLNGHGRAQAASAPEAAPVRQPQFDSMGKRARRRTVTHDKHVLVHAGGEKQGQAHGGNGRGNGGGNGKEEHVPLPLPGQSWYQPTGEHVYQAAAPGNGRNAGVDLNMRGGPDALDSAFERM